MNQAHSLQPMLSTRERLLQTALDLFSSQGYQATSLRDLATRLGVQPGSLYNHVESKQSLLFELMEETMDDLLDQTRLAVRRTNNTHSPLYLFVQTLVYFQLNHPNRLCLIDREIMSLSYAQFEQIRALRHEYEQCLVSVISDEKTEPLLSKSKMAVLVGAITGMLHSLTRWSEDARHTSPQELVEQLFNLISAATRASIH